MTDEQPRMFRLASVPASISSGWSLAWRVLLIAIAITFVLGSLWELKLDFSQAGPLILRSRDIYPVPDTGGYPANRQFNFGISGVRGHAHVVVILTGLDTANNAVRAQIGVSLDQALAGQLRLVDGSRKLPLNDSDSSRWATLPVKVQLVQCISRSCTAESSVQMRLRDLLPADTAPFTSTVDLFADADPGAYPQDKYVVTISPQLELPPNIEIPSAIAETSSGEKFDLGVPVSMNPGTEAAIVGKDVAILSSRGGRQIIVSRPWLAQSLTYAISAIPALLGFLVFCLFLAGRMRAGDSGSGLTAIVGLLAAWLTILPLRTVLVPQELASAPLTRVDDLLIFDAAAVFLFSALVFTMIRRAPASKDAVDETNDPSAYSISIPPASPLFIGHAVASLDSASPGTRRDAIATLAMARVPSADIVLREALRHPISDVRSAAAEALRKTRDPAAVPALIQALRDNDKNVRLVAARALGEIRDSAAVPGLREIRRDPDRQVRHAAARALRMIAVRR